MGTDNKRAVLSGKEKAEAQRQEVKLFWLLPFPISGNQQHGVQQLLCIESTMVWVGRGVKDHLVPNPAKGRDTFH